MPKPLTIVVGGYIIGYPLGGMTWHHLNYLLGLQALGHEVWFLEDSGQHSRPYNPTTWQCSDDSVYGRAYLERTLADFGFPPRWCYYSEAEDRHYGLTREELNAVLKRADLLLCISGITPIRPDRPRPRRIAVIDTDPVFTQLRLENDLDFQNYYKQFDAVATFGRLIGTAACPLPTHGFNWIPTNPPIALRHWPMSLARGLSTAHKTSHSTALKTGRSFTTIGKWEHSSERNLEFQGMRFLSSKADQWREMLDLPFRVPWEMTLGMSSIPVDISAQFRSHGWKLIDAEQATLNCRSFADFVRDSAGEFTVAKELYSTVPTGWFSDRSAAYLASGRPVVTQDTGFDQWLPTGEGLFSYVTIENAADALNRIATDPQRHSAAARRIAEDYFDSEKVLTALLERAL